MTFPFWLVFDDLAVALSLDFAELKVSADLFSSFAPSEVLTSGVCCLFPNNPNRDHLFQLIEQKIAF